MKLYSIAAALVLLATGAAAQSAEDPMVTEDAVVIQDPVMTRAFELRPFVGAFVPTGDQREEFEDATMVGGELAVELAPHWHLLGFTGWTHGHNTYAALSEDLTYIWQYDVGAEFNLLYHMGESWLFRPFVGAGGGARTYDYQAEGLEAKTFPTGYGALGAEFQSGNMAYRLEMRDFVSGFEDPFTGEESTRNDIGLSLGFAFHIR